MSWLGQQGYSLLFVYLQHSENRYGQTRHEEEGSGGSEEDEFFKKVREL